MKNALIIGGTGLIGKHLTELLLGDKRYDKVTVLVRKPLDKIHQKLEQVVFDFDNPDESILHADELFCSLGTTIKSAGSKAAFHKVDYDYVLSVAKLSFQNGTKKFALVSSMGANKNSSVFYNKNKGQIEEAVSKIGFEKCFIFRPSILLGYRSQIRPGESLAVLFMSSFSFLLPERYKPIRGQQVAKAMVELMNSDETGVQIIESDKFHAFR